MTYKHSKKMHMRSWLVIGLVAFIVGLAVFNTKDLIFGAPLSIATATDGTTVESAFLPVSGNAKHARDVRINGRSVTLDRKGNFADSVILSPGYNVVEVALKDQFGKEKVKTYHLVVREETDPVASVSGQPYQ